MYIQADDKGDNIICCLVVPVALVLWWNLLWCSQSGIRHQGYAVWCPSAPSNRLITFVPHCLFWAIALEASLKLHSCEVCEGVRKSRCCCEKNVAQQMMLRLNALNPQNVYPAPWQKRLCFWPQHPVPRYPAFIFCLPNPNVGKVPGIRSGQLLNTHKSEAWQMLESP